MSERSSRRHTKRLLLAKAANALDLFFLTGRIAIDAAASPDEPKGPRRFSMEAYSGGPLPIEGFPVPVVVDLAGMDLRSKQLPIYFGHHDGSDGTKLVGHTDRIDKSEMKLLAAGAISAVNDYARQVLDAHDNGYQWQASIGAAAQRDRVEFVDRRKTAEANGRRFPGPVIVARKSLLRHIAVLPEGADNHTSVAIAAAVFSSKEKVMDFEKWIQAMFGGEVPELTDAQTAALEKRYDAEIKAAADKKKAPDTKPDTKDKDGTPISAALKPPAFDLSACVLCYEKHVAEIEAKASPFAGKIDAAKLGEINTAARTSAIELKAKALNEEWPAPRLEIELVKAAAAHEVELIRAERPRAPAIHGSTRDLSGSVIEAALCQGLGIANHEKEYSDEVLQAAHTAFRGRVGIQQLLLMAAASNGYSCGLGQRVDTGNVREVIGYALPTDIRAAQASTINLPNIFSNVANKELLAGFMEEDQTWREIAAVKNVADFKTATSYRMLDNMEYEELPPDGQIKHGQVGEETFTRQARTYAKMFALTRTDIVNDDLGALDDLRTRLGRGAARKFNKVFWAAFMNNGSFFTTGRGNYITGATTTLLTDFVGLALAIAAFDALKSTAVPPAKTGDRIGGTPTILLVPPELEAVAMRIHAVIAASETANINIYSGKYKPVKVHQLSDSNYTGNSATAWYLLRNPTVLAAMVVSLLNGNANPIVESAEASFDRLGIEFRGYHDFGCDQAEYLAGVKSKGSA